jgi:hypothetical protein
VKYAARLDMDTRMLRRVYEMLVVGGSSRLKVLDGLSVDRSVLSANDKVWDALLSAGVLEAATPTMTAEGDEAELGKEDKEESQPESAPEPENSSIWQGEDSFA